MVSVYIYSVSSSGEWSPENRPLESRVEKHGKILTVNFTHAGRIWSGRNPRMLWKLPRSN
jgi:hypothetical protein